MQRLSIEALLLHGGSFATTNLTRYLHVGTNNILAFRLALVAGVVLQKPWYALNQHENG